MLGAREWILTMSEPMIRTEDLGKRFPVKEGLFRRVVDYETAVRDVSIELNRGEILGLVGESGSGKTTLARLILRLLEPTAGEIYFQGNRVDNLKPSLFMEYRRWIQVIFQDPQESLDPRFRVKDCVEEGMKYVTDWSRGRRLNRVRTLLDQVGLGEELMNRYPHQLSGGQRQRVGIARALAVEPDVIVCDEPTSALDVSIQAQIINLLLDLREQHDLSYVFISHDLSLIRFISDRVAVMKDGEIVERGPASRIYDSPGHDYTVQLLESATEHRKTLA